MKEEELYWFLDVSKYPEILKTLKDNINKMLLDGNRLRIRIHEMEYTLIDKELKRFMTLLLAINNEICHQYRIRKRIKKSTNYSYD